MELEGLLNALPPDAVAWVEQHNNSGAAPLIDLWPEAKLETLLAQKPYLAAAHGLR